eukprot:c11739_g1_i1.p1 GENE.c11739_g1_i1~~c11739_g1_i1.p1  ORF type:complete len:152 (+),score=41.14 c11739_g1_i1:23-457(+)
MAVLTTELQDKWKEAFKLGSENGSLSSDRLWLVLRSLGLNMDQEETKKFEQTVSKEGKVSEADFLSAMKDRLSNSYDAQLSKAFQKCCRDENQVLYVEELGKIMKQIGMDLTKEELQQMIDVADTEGKGGIDLSTFKKRLISNE